MFKPHNFTTKVRYANTAPSILISQEAYLDMEALVDLVNDEVGWLGTAYRLPKSGNIFIDKIYLPKQEVASTTTEISAEGIADMAMEIMAENPGEEGLEIANAIRFWGHSHVYMDTFASGQDEKQMEVFEETCDDFFVRGIFNKKGKASFSVFLFDKGLIFDDVSWSIWIPTEECITEKWEQEIKDKVTKIVYTPPKKGKNYKEPKIGVVEPDDEPDSFYQPSLYSGYYGHHSNNDSWGWGYDY